MKKAGRYFIKAVCLFLTLYVFVLAVHCEEDTDNSAFDLMQGNTFISNASAHHKPPLAHNAHISREHKQHKKYPPVKRSSVKIIAQEGGYNMPKLFAAYTHHTTPLIEKYKYLYFREINPPPPKQSTV